MKSLCIIPARGGSKRIPGKNVKNFSGRPIISYSIKAALDSNLFEEVMVSTDDKQIAEIAEVYGARVPFLRSKENANDFAGLAEVLIEVLSLYQNTNQSFDYVCCILPTAPFITSDQLIQAENIITTGKYDCVFPVVEYSYPIQRSLKIDNDFIKMRWPENLSKRSQDLEPTYHDSGQFYFIEIKALFREKKLFTAHSGYFILNNLEVQDIDTDVDWKLAELKFQLLKGNK